MKIVDYLDKTIKKIEGSLIGIGFEEEKIINTINQNKKIRECYLLDCPSLDFEEGKSSTIRIGKLRKKFKKKKPDYIIYNIKNIKDYKDKFVYDSIFLTKNTIIIYNLDNEIDVESILRRYKRYGEIEMIKCSNGTIYKITQIKKITKTNEFYNKIKDDIISLGDFISNLLSDS